MNKIGLYHNLLKQFLLSFGSQQKKLPPPKCCRSNHLFILLVGKPEAVLNKVLFNFGSFSILKYISCNGF